MLLCIILFSRQYYIAKTEANCLCTSFRSNMPGWNGEKLDTNRPFEGSAEQEKRFLEARYRKLLQVRNAESKVRLTAQKNFTNIHSPLIKEHKNVIENFLVAENGNRQQIAKKVQKNLENLLIEKHCVMQNIDSEQEMQSEF